MLQALACCLDRRGVDSLSGSVLLDHAMSLANRLPPRAREWAYSFGGMTEAVSRKRLSTVDFDEIANWMTGLLPPRQYPAIFIGSSNGALVHLAAALDIPWLPQTFLCPVREVWNDPDDAAAGFARGRAVAEAIERQRDDIAVHHMHDPNQDRLMLRGMTYFRLKFRSLPVAYREFLLEHLPAGSTIYVTFCRKRWPVMRMSERSVFQFGAVGGLEAAEYFQDSDRIANYLARYRSRRRSWSPPAPNDSAPEAEWGFDPALLDDILTLAAAQQWRVVVLDFEEPEALSFVTAAVYRAWYDALGQNANRLLVDSFVLMDPYRTIRLRAIPFWLLFAVEPSVTALRQFLEREPPFTEIDMMLFSHGTEGAGVAKIDDWRHLLKRARRSGCFLGVDEARYPRDFATFARFPHALARLGLPFELAPPLSLECFETLVRTNGPQFGVDMSRNLRVTAASSTGAV